MPMQENNLVPLSVNEQKRLHVLEQVISDNFNGFVAVGKALAEIRDKGLYRQSHSIFEEYCRDLWDVSRPRAYQLIDSAHVIDNLSTIVDTEQKGVAIDFLPANEAQARELARLTPEDQVTVWRGMVQQATAGGGDSRPKITAIEVKKAVKAHKGEKLERHIKGATKGIRENRKEFASEEFVEAFTLFLAQVDQARREDWRHTSRQAAHGYIATLLELVAEAGGSVEQEPVAAMELDGRDKLKAAGFSLFRLDSKQLSIEEWQQGDSWSRYANHESKGALLLAFTELMRNPKNLKA